MLEPKTADAQHARGTRSADPGTPRMNISLLQEVLEADRLIGVKIESSTVIAY